MAQSAACRMVFNVLLVLTILASITYADIDSCQKFCNKHRPNGSSDGYNITCAEASSSGNETEMSSCKKECESCSKLCSNENFNCPRAEAFLTSYSSGSSSTSDTEGAGFIFLVILLFFIYTLPITIPICILIGLCIWACKRQQQQNQYLGFGAQPYGQVPMYLPYQPQVGGATGTPETGQPQNYQA